MQDANLVEQRADLDVIRTEGFLGEGTGPAARRWLGLGVAAQHVEDLPQAGERLDLQPIDVGVVLPVYIEDASRSAAAGPRPSA